MHCRQAAYESVSQLEHNTSLDGAVGRRQVEWVKVFLPDFFARKSHGQVERWYGVWKVLFDAPHLLVHCSLNLFVDLLQD